MSKKKIGFMVDWVRPTRHTRWLACEKQMYRELMNEKFPGSGSPSSAVVLEFDRRAIERAWIHIRQTVERVRPRTAIIQNLCGWPDHDASVWQTINSDAFGLYGFAKADPMTTLVTDSRHLKNIEHLRKAFASL